MSGWEFARNVVSVLTGLVITCALPGGGQLASAQETRWPGSGMELGTFPVHGTKGEPDPENTPGGRRSAVSWTDDEGALWLFGGGGWVSEDERGQLNDLWRYDPTTGEWTWMKGANTINEPGVYGVQGVPDPANTLGARRRATAWTDHSGNLWLFGGYEEHYSPPNVTHRYFNDLWKYNPETGEWTWMKGHDTTGEPGIYGTPGVPHSDNTPGARRGAASWTDESGALWLVCTST